MWQGQMNGAWGALRLRRLGKIEESFDPLSFEAAAARECDASREPPSFRRDG